MGKETILVILLAAVGAVMYWLFGAVQQKHDTDGRLMMRQGCFGKWKRTPAKRLKPTAQ